MRPSAAHIGAFAHLRVSFFGKVTPFCLGSNACHYRTGQFAQRAMSQFGCRRQFQFAPTKIAGPLPICRFRSCRSECVSNYLLVESETLLTMRTLQQSSCNAAICFLKTLFCPGTRSCAENCPRPAQRRAGRSVARSYFRACRNVQEWNRQARLLRLRSAKRNWDG